MKTFLCVTAVLASLAAPASARVAIPIEMRGKWCDSGVATPSSPSTRNYLRCDADAEAEFEVTSTALLFPDADCKAIKIVPFNIYRKNPWGPIKNPWGPGQRITFRCSIEHHKPSIRTEEWQIIKEYLSVKEVL